MTLEGPVDEVEFDLEADIATAARHYLGAEADQFILKIKGALASGRQWASFELRPTLIDHKVQSLH